MTKWILVRNSDGKPIRRPSSRTQFERYNDGFDPNLPGKFGPNEACRFVQVVYGTDPTFDPLQEELNMIGTAGVTGEIFSGHLVSDQWVVEKMIVPLVLGEVKRMYVSKMEEEMNDRLNQGYVRGNRTLDLDSGTLSRLTGLVTWMETARAGSVIPNDHEIVIEDRDEKPFTMTYNQLRTLLANYGKTHMDILEESRRARRDISQAVDTNAVRAVTWTF